MHPRSQPSEKGADELEVAVDEAIAACGGDMRSTIRSLIVANEYLESEACELMAAVSHAYVRGRFRTYSGKSMILKSMPSGLTRGWVPVLRKDHAQTKR